MKIVATLIGAVAIVAAPVAASAAGFSPTEEITFTYELDAEMLDTPAGAAAVYKDLVSEARTACTMAGSRGFTTVDEACIDDLVAKVVAALDAPMLTATVSEPVEEAFVAPLTVAER